MLLIFKKVFDFKIFFLYPSFFLRKYVFIFVFFLKGGLKEILICC